MKAILDLKNSGSLSKKEMLVALIIATVVFAIIIGIFIHVSRQSEVNALASDNQSQLSMHMWEGDGYIAMEFSRADGSTMSSLGSLSSAFEDQRLALDMERNAAAMEETLAESDRVLGQSQLLLCRTGGVDYCLVVRENPRMFRMCVEEASLCIAYQPDYFFRRFGDGLAPVRLCNGRWTYINENGERVFDVDFRSAYPFSNGLARVWIDTARTYFINTDGEVAFDANFRQALCFSEGLAAVLLDNSRWIFINMGGEQVFDTEFRWARNFSEGFAYVSTDDDGSFFINKSGERAFGTEVVPTPNSQFRGGFASVRFGEGFNFINNDGEIVFDTGFFGIHGYGEGWAIVAIDDDIMALIFMSVFPEHYFLDDFAMYYFDRESTQAVILPNGAHWYLREDGIGEILELGVYG
ncbi:MAG: WG repeat-containing protein [Pseudomonadales bacterium]|jgi:hypothetical protein|nr:WG repeat-containing protein [Pseudomonadales bacterium]